MPPFVVQEHRDGQGRVHWDIMLAQEDVEQLATWQVPQPPEQWPAGPIACSRLPDHRRHYLTYQGPVSGGRGVVTIKAQGLCCWREKAEKRWRVRLESDKLRGELDLQQQDGNTWTLLWTGNRDDE